MIIQSRPFAPAVPRSSAKGVCSLEDQRHIKDTLSRASMDYDTMKFAYAMGTAAALGSGAAAVGTVTRSLTPLAGLGLTAGAAGLAGVILYLARQSQLEVNATLHGVAEFNREHGCYTNDQLETLWQNAV